MKPESDLLAQACEQAAMKAVSTDTAILALLPSSTPGQCHYIGIDPASDVPDHYVEAVFRMDEQGAHLISIQRHPNASLLRKAAGSLPDILTAARPAATVGDAP